MNLVKSRTDINYQPTKPVGGNRVSNTFYDVDALKGVLADLSKAKTKIQFENFLFNGEHGQAIANALIAKHKQGVKVQVLLDGTMQKRDGEVLAKQLRAEGIEVNYFRAKSMNAPSLDTPYSVEHSKLVVVDDELAWVGGVNFDQEINRDMMTRIEGPAVRDLQKTFEEGWTNAGGKLLPTKGKIAPKGDVWVGVSQTGPKEQSTRPQVLSELKAIGKGDAVDLWMMDLGDPLVLDAMEAAHDRGAKIRVLVDLKVPFTSGKPSDAIAKAIAGGVPDLPAIRRLQALDIEVKAYVPPEGITKLHSKVWLFTHDAGKPEQTHRVIGGTVNAIKGAYEYNHEVGVLFYGKGVGEDVQAAFEEDFTKNAASIPKLGKWDRFKSGIVELLNQTII
jgi:phosphatidylserine/phosphatidylglycerophosphate/cardiolipin synthase-like enzyme